MILIISRDVINVCVIQRELIQELFQSCITIHTNPLLCLCSIDFQIKQIIIADQEMQFII